MERITRRSDQRKYSQRAAAVAATGGDDDDGDDGREVCSSWPCLLLLFPSCENLRSKHHPKLFSRNTLEPSQFYPVFKKGFYMQNT